MKYHYKTILFFSMLIFVFMCSSCNEKKDIYYNQNISGTYIMDQECFYNINRFHINGQYIEDFRFTLKITNEGNVYIHRDTPNKYKYGENIYDIEFEIKLSNSEITNYNLYLFHYDMEDARYYIVYENGNKDIIFQIVLPGTQNCRQYVNVSKVTIDYEYRDKYTFIEHSEISNLGYVKI